MAQGSVIVNASSDVIARTANLPSFTAFTIGGWFKRTTDRDSYENYIGFIRTGSFLMSVQNRPSGDGNWIGINDDQGGGANYGSGEPAITTWFYIALTNNGTNAKLYWYNTSFALVGSVLSIGSNSFTGTTSEVNVLRESLYSTWANARCAQVRVWDAVLSQSEIAAECASSTIVRTSNINTAFEDDPATDVSGNSRPWTTSGITVDASDYPPNYAGGATTINPYVARGRQVGFLAGRN